MRGIFSLLLSFRKYFRKYSFMLFLFILIVVLVPVYRSMINDIEFSYAYHDSSVIRGDCRLILEIDDYETITSAFRRAVEENCGSVTGESVVYPAEKIYALTADGDRVYYDLIPSGKLEGSEVIIFSEYVPDGGVRLYDTHLGKEIDVTLLVDDRMGVALGLNIYEAMCSVDIYMAVAGRDHTFVDKPYYGIVDYTIDGNVDYSKVLLSFVNDREIKILALRNRNIQSVQLIDNLIASKSGMRKTYQYYFNLQSLREIRNTMYRRFTVELVNELDRLKMPLYILDRFISILENLVLAAFIFISYSVFKVRESEFTIYRSLGMTKAKLTFLLFLEELVMLLFVAVVSFLMILLVQLLLNFIRPLGVRLVEGEALYFRDIFTYYGKYSMSRVWFYYLERLANLAIYFLGISFSMNFVLLCFKERREKRI